MDHFEKVFEEEYLLFQLQTGYVIEFNYNGKVPPKSHDSFLFIGHAMLSDKKLPLFNRLVRVGQTTLSAIGPSRLYVLHEIQTKLKEHNDQNGKA